MCIEESCVEVSCIERFWKQFLANKGLGEQTKYIDCFHFELSEYLANELLRLVLIGQKRATASSLWAYEIEGDRIPQAGDYSIVTDWDGNPRCVIQTTNVRILPFREITYDICKLEGEDDNLESWRKGHISFFRAEGKELGYTFSEDMPVIFEEFEVVYQAEQHRIEYRPVYEGELCRELFQDFVRHQKVTKCWRKENGQWLIKDIAFTDDWSEKEYETLVTCLKHTASTGGFVYAAFEKGVLKGFTSVEPELFGGEQKYLDLFSIHVSEDMRGRGIGKTLFLAAKDWARQHGGRKLYISAHSSVESQAFYKAMGCVEAQVYNRKHVEEEPCDCQLECEL